MFFCSKCGTKVGAHVEAAAQPIPPQSPAVQSIPQPISQPSGGYSMTFTRESSVVGILSGVTVVVNGIDYGNIASGESKTINHDSPNAIIELKSMGVKSIRATLNVVNNVHVSFKMQIGLGWPKLVFVSITGAEVLQMQ
jgi:hypothetical protein